MDADLLGWEPLAGAGGLLVAAMWENDRQAKLIVARLGTVWTDEELRSAVEFQERFSVSKLVRLRP